MNAANGSSEGANGLVGQHCDFTLAFQHGRKGHDERGIEYTIRVLHLGDLNVTTGQIVACDPFWLTTAPEPFTTAVPLGGHPVLVSLVSFADGDQRVACAMLRFTPGEPVR